MYERPYILAQDLQSPLGKILRIDVNSGDPYSVPADNPFADSKDALPEIYAYGLHNPWRMSFDAGGEHHLFAADVGQNSYEEVDIIVKGANYGWNRMEGTHCFNPDDPNKHPETCDKSGLIIPIAEYGNLNVVKDGKGISVTTPWFVDNTLVTGRPGTAMPSWVDRFSNEELWQLTAFMVSLGDQARPGSR